MARYIDIEGAGIGKANREQFLVPEFADGWNAVLKILEKEPTADVVEVKHGEWIVDKERQILRVRHTKPIRSLAYKCSECGCKSGNNKYLNYCHRCGAKMDGGNAE